MKSARSNEPGPAALAKVIALRPAVMSVADADEAPSRRVVLDVARDDALLRRRVGERWRELPVGLGRPLVALERALAAGPTALDPTVTTPAEALGEASSVIDAACTHIDALIDESEVLGDVLGVDLVSIDLRRLDQVAGAVLDLARTEPGDPSWADPAHAAAAAVVLDAHGDELREGTARHREMHERFTDTASSISDGRLAAARRGRRLVARWRVRRDLALASRTGRTAGPIESSIDLLERARAASARAQLLAPLLERHLGRHHRGVLTDVDATSASLAAVRRLQDALGAELDHTRLGDLLLAEAFSSMEVTAPALALRAELQSWQAEVARLCGGDPWAVPAGALGAWAERVAGGLRLLSEGLRAAASIGSVPGTVRELVDDLLLRDHAHETLLLALTGRPAGTGSGL